MTVSFNRPAIHGNSDTPGSKASSRWRIKATFGTLTNRYRRLTRNLEQNPKAAEDAMEIASFHRVLRAYRRDKKSQSNRLLHPNRSIKCLD